MQRYFAKNKEEDKLILRDSDIRHIKKVMRMKTADKIEVVYDSKLYLCKIVNIDDFDIAILEEKEEDNELAVEIVIAIALVKEQKFDLILQKLTELGVSKILPLKMERNVIKLDDNKFLKKKERWESICKEASEQSHRNLVPEILPMMSLKELISEDADLKMVASVKENDNLLNNYLQNKKNCAKMIVVIGPEGGISPKEEEFLNANGYTSISFGSRVLRVETAAIYIASILNYINMR